MTMTKESKIGVATGIATGVLGGAAVALETASGSSGGASAGFGAVAIGGGVFFAMFNLMAAGYTGSIAEKSKSRFMKAAFQKESEKHLRMFKASCVALLVATGCGFAVNKAVEAYRADAPQAAPAAPVNPANSVQKFQHGAENVGARTGPR